MASVSSPAGADGRSPERRRHSRCRIIERQLVTVNLGPDQRGLLVDVSLGGAAVQPYMPVQAGQTSNLYFQLPGNGERVDAEGLITWVGPSGRAGIEFTRLSEPAVERLKRWIEAAAAPAQSQPKSANQSTAAFLPPSYSPWVKTRERNVQPTEDEELSSLDLVSALRLVVERARSITRSSGAAIALADGGEMVCRARTGIAPDLGARFHPESGLSGECVRAAKVVRCKDTETDNRVDRTVCDRLGVRSIAIVPVLASDVVIGVIEVFYPQPEAFSERDVLNLQRLADLVAAMLETGLGPPEPPGNGPHPEEDKSNVEGSPPTTLTARVAAAMERALLPAGDGEVEETDAAAEKPQLSPSEITSIFERFTADAEEEDRSRRRRLLISAAAVLLAISLGGWGTWEVTRKAPEKSNVHNFNVEKSGRGAAPSGNSAPVSSAIRPVNTDQTKPAIRQTASALRPRETNIVRQKTVAQSVTPGRSVAQDWTWKATAEPDEPAVMAARPNDDQNLHILSENGLAPESANFVEGKLLNGAVPALTAGASKGITGSVVLRIQIGTDGNVSNIRQVSGNPLLGATAIKIVQNWRYEPYKLGGHPVAVEKNVTVNFPEPKTAKK